MTAPTPLRARYWKINQLVERLLADYSVSQAPVPIEKIVEGFGIEIRSGDLNDVSGLLIRNSEEIVIGINSTQRNTRQRFTMAHELGHYLLHDGISSHLDRDYRVNFRSIESSQATNIEEIEANYFAACLLMPKRFLAQDNAVSALDSDQGVSELAKRYNVSQHAMSLRLANVYGDQRPF